MNTIHVVHKSNLPSKLPVNGTLIILLSLDFWNAPTWLWWSGIILIIYRWVIVLIRIYNQKQFDLFPGTLNPKADASDKSLKAKFEKIIKEG